MSILIDSGAWFAKLHERDQDHEAAQAIFAACMDGAHGQVFTTSDVVDETFTLALSRAGADSGGMIQDLAGFVGFTETRPTVASVLDVDRERQRAVWPLFERHYEEKGLSFTDCTSLVTMRERGIDKIASFDDGFDGLVERVDGSQGA